MLPVQRGSIISETGRAQRAGAYGASCRQRGTARRALVRALGDRGVAEPPPDVADDGSGPRAHRAHAQPRAEGAFPPAGQQRYSMRYSKAYSKAHCTSCVLPAPLSTAADRAPLLIASWRSATSGRDSPFEASLRASDAAGPSSTVAHRVVPLSRKAVRRPSGAKRHVEGPPPLFVLLNYDLSSSG